MKYEILLFDADNTILDFDKAEEQALGRAFAECGLHFDDNVLQVYRKNNLRQWQLFEQGKLTKNEVIINRFAETFKELGLTVKFDKASELYEEYLHIGFFVVNHAKDVLQKLQNVCRLYLVTNGVKTIQDSRMKGSGMEKYFIKRFVSEEVGYPKPQKEFFDYCFERISDFDKSRALIIGDSLTSDIQGGVNAEIDTCWFNPNHIVNSSNMTPNYEIDDLRQLTSIVNGNK